MLTDLAFLLALILLNGVFALSEIAIVSSRRVRLLQLAESGNTGAVRAFALAAEPTRFLSTVQVGITSIGILSGAIGEAAIAGRLRVELEPFPLLAPHAGPISLAVMVVGLTYVSLILGELVPKRLALTRPETFAAVIAAPMRLLSRATSPLVHLLSLSTDAVVGLLRVPKVNAPALTVEELKVLMAQGAEEGVFEPSERELVTNVLNLDERHVGRVPRIGDVFERGGHRFEIVDMDGNRVDRLLVSRLPS
ncbi:MAG: CNNM domain-containing protein [Vicinamibacterales bacterium]